MNLNYDMISLFLIFFIVYYVLFIISNNYVIEGVGNAEVSETVSSGALMCLNYDDPSNDFHKCNEWPFDYKTYASTTKQCLDGTDSCTEEAKINNCCRQKAEMCQGNIAPQFVDYICRGENNILKIGAVSLPKLCDYEDDGENIDKCWDGGYPGQSNPPGLQGCDNMESTCNLRDISDEKRQEICCTRRQVYELGEQEWGVPYLISVANLKYNDVINIQDTESSEYSELLNGALSYLDQARDIGMDDRSVTATIEDWGKGVRMDLGNGMCRGNINRSTGFPCLTLTPPKQYINNEFITKGTTEEECCVVSGMCSGNTFPIENVECPDNMKILSNIEGTTIEECCEENIKCSGNKNIYLNFDCSEPLVPVADSKNTFGNTSDKCCRFPDETHYTEISPTFENETIQGTLIFNGDLIQTAGMEGSTKRISFEDNFKEDICNVFNKEGKTNILVEQISINKIYSGSIIVDFEVVPDLTTAVSISKDYYSYLLSEKLYFPTLKLHTNGGVTNVSVFSWYNINHWPSWIWYVIISFITFLITVVIVI